MTGKFGVGTAVLALGALGMLTEKSTPAKAELLAVVCFELMVTSVSRPMTAEGLTTKTLPFPLFVLIATLVLPMHDADAVPEQMPVSSQKPLTVSQVVPLARHGVVSAAGLCCAPAIGAYRAGSAPRGNRTALHSAGYTTVGAVEHTRSGPG